MRTLFLLWRCLSWRHWLQAPKATLLLITIIALGVGVFLSIRLANRAAVAGFELFTETLTGQSDFALLPLAGELAETVLPEIRSALGTAPISLFPVVETTATDARGDKNDEDFESEQFQLLGVDLMSLPNLVYLDERPQASPVQVERPNPATETSTNVWALMGQHHQVFISGSLAARRKFRVGDSLAVVVNDRPAVLEIRGILPQGEFQASAPANILVMDLPAVQLLAAKQGRITRIEVRLPPGKGRGDQVRHARELLEQLGHGRWAVETPLQQKATGELMTRAFRLNLTILSGLALLVGTYLILQALEAAVVKRRSEIAILHSLGVEPRVIQKAWLFEALTLGLFGTACGIVLGFVGAQFAVRAVARTVNALYYTNTTKAAALDWQECLFAAAVGVAASLLAGWLPARDAARTPPAQVLQSGVRGGGLQFLARPWLGAAIALAGVGLYFVPPLELAHHIRFPAAGYLAALCWVVGASVLVGLSFPVLAVLLGMAGQSGATLRYAASQLRIPLGRHRLAAAGLVIAIGMASGMSILIHSFERTMRTWIQQSLTADLYVSCRGVANMSSRNRMGAETWQALAQDPDVAEVDIGQAHPIRLQGIRTSLVGASFNQRSRYREMIWVQAPADPRLELSRLGDVYPALVSESFSERFRARRGDAITIPTPTGARNLEVRGVFAEYGNERGTVVVRREYVVEWFQDNTALNVAAYLKPGIDAETVRRRWAAAHRGVTVRTNNTLRSEVLKVFRQTFSVTYALKGIGVAVAVAGLGLALTSLLLERRNELRTLRELGMSRHQIARATAIEGMAVAGAGMVGGLVLSVALGYLLIFVINKQSFGWTLAFALPGSQMLSLALLILPISWGVSYAVGRWGARLPIEQEE